MPTPNEQKIINKLEAMTIEEARAAVARKDFGHSQDHRFASEWLDIKEASLRAAREAETLSIAKEANSEAKAANRIASKALDETRRSRCIDRTIAISAITIAAIAARADIKWFISWLVSILKNSLTN